MVIREYPQEIQALLDLLEPYWVGCHLENAPKEAEEALKKLRDWAFEQEQ